MPKQNEKLDRQLEKLVGDAHYCQRSRHYDGRFEMEGHFSVETLEAVIALIKKESHASEEDKEAES